MLFKATDVFQYFKPSCCERRVSLLAHGIEPEIAPDPFQDLLVRLGHRHEAEHLATLPDVLDLSAPKDRPEERERRTREAIRTGVSAIYQARFREYLALDGETCELVGEPDFVLRSADGRGHAIRDSKLARRLESDRHAGISLQLQIYGFLYERAAGAPPAALEVHSGTGEIVPVPYEGATAVLSLLREHRRMRAIDPAAYEPVGWSKCAGCGYNERCWTEARTARDVSTLPGVDQALARMLHGRGVGTLSQLDAAFGDPSLRDVFYDPGTKKRPPALKKSGLRVRRALDAALSGRPILFAPLDLPASEDCVAFDLEGLPAYADELQKIYLWGLKDFGREPPRAAQSLARFGEDGDREAWTGFLREAGALLERRPAARFVHWGSYERTNVSRYAELYGDPEGRAALVLERCLDLLTLVKGAVALPLESYGLKAVGAYAGFARRLDDYEGGRAIARYIEAVECREPVRREEILAEIAAYNEEDLDATRHVLEWLRRLPPAPA